MRSNQSMSGFEGTETKTDTDRTGGAGTFELSILAIVNLLLAHWKVLVTLPVLTMLLAAFLSFFNRHYVAESAFLPVTPATSTSRLAGVAAQFGFDFGSEGAGESVEFYARLLRSRDVLSELATTTFTFATDLEGTEVVSDTVINLLDVPLDPIETRVRRTVAELDGLLDVSTDITAGLVTIRVTSPWAELSEMMNERLLELVNEFNLRKRQSQASAERRFIEERMEGAFEELQNAERALEAFLADNRSYEDSPRLTFEAARLQRRVDHQQQVHVTLAQAYEQARIDEVRNTPVITILDHPDDSAKPTSGLILTAAVGLLLGAMLAFTILVFGTYFSRQKTDDPVEYARFRQLWSSAKQDLTGIVRMTRGARS